MPTFMTQASSAIECYGVSCFKEPHRKVASSYFSHFSSITRTGWGYGMDEGWFARVILQTRLGVQVDLGDRNFSISVKGRLEGKISYKRILFCPKETVLTHLSNFCGCSHNRFFFLVADLVLCPFRFSAPAFLLDLLSSHVPCT